MGHDMYVSGFRVSCGHTELLHMGLITVYTETRNAENGLLWMRSLCVCVWVCVGGCVCAHLCVGVCVWERALVFISH